MYGADWFTKERMTEWEEQDDRTKTFEECKAHFKRYYIARKWFHNAKGIKMEKVNMIDNELIQWWEAMKDKTTKKQKSAEKELQHLTTQNIVLVELVKTK